MYCENCFWQTWQTIREGGSKRGVVEGFSEVIIGSAMAKAVQASKGFGGRDEVK